jgi:hypothetical protein
MATAGFTSDTLELSKVTPDDDGVSAAPKFGWAEVPNEIGAMGAGSFSLTASRLPCPGAISATRGNGVAALVEAAALREGSGLGSSRFACEGVTSPAAELAPPGFVAVGTAATGWFAGAADAVCVVLNQPLL